MTNEERLYPKPCPKCGRRLLMAGRPFKITTPRWLRWLRMRYPIGVCCVYCGYWKRSLRAWNKIPRERKTCNNCRHNRVPIFEPGSPCYTCISGVDRGMRLDPTNWEPKEEDSE